MNQNKNFVASLIAAVGSFMLLPLSFYWFYSSFEGLSAREPLIWIVFFALFLVNLAVFVTETVATIRLAKGKQNHKAFSIVTMVLNGLFVVLAIVNLIVLFVAEFGGFNFEVFIILCMYYLTYVFCAAANGTSLAFKLVDMLKK